MCRSPGQNSVELQNFLSSLEDLINEITCLNSLFYVILEDFNSLSPAWWTDDKTSIEGAQLGALSSIYRLDQLITEPTHLMEQSIDLIFYKSAQLCHRFWSSSIISH